MTNGFVRVAAACPRLNVADVEFNVANILRVAGELFGQGVAVAVFPELSLTGYTCGDLFHQHTLLEAAAAGLLKIREAMARDFDGHAIVVGLPRTDALTSAVYNSAAFVTATDCVFVDKTFLPNYGEFYEKRWFQPAVDQQPKVIEFGGVRYGIELCEDLWAPIPPSSMLSLAGAEVILNLSASNDLIGKYEYLTKLIGQQSARCCGGYVYASAGFGESTTDLVYDGKGIVAERGRIVAERSRWSDDESVVTELDIEVIRQDRLRTNTFEDNRRLYGPKNAVLVSLRGADTTDAEPSHRRINPAPFIPADSARLGESVNIMTLALTRRLEAIRCSRIVIGISGGLDSTLALLIACRAMDRLGLPRTGITAVTLPGFGTSGRTHDNALTLMRELGVTSREIPIGPAVLQHFSDIGQDPDNHDVTYENSQARERTQILMDIANQENGIVVGTGDMSELALGWATYNGDQMSMYGVNAGIPKTLVRELVRWCAEQTDSEQIRSTLLDIVDTPISPELTPADSEGHIAQKTEDLVGPYELHDFFLYHMLRHGSSPERIRMLARRAFAGVYDDATIDRWLDTFMRRFFTQQFKRSAMPDGPKVTYVGLSPRGDWRMPSDASRSAWL
ncbi:MAG: NAD(+) synthase [Clostridium sp.]|nr:NAD(+) synthase [Clostridium sp.]